MTSIRRTGAKHLAALALVGLALPAGAAGQQAAVVQEPRVLSAGGAPGQEDLDLTRTRSLFDLQAFGDEGSAGIRSDGRNWWCFQNIVGFAARNNFGCNTGWYTRRRDGAMDFTVFDVVFAWAAPPSDLPSTIDPVASGLRGGGWTVNMTTLIIGGAVLGGGDKLWASDRSSAELMAVGVQTTEDATCQNHSAGRDGNMNAGFQLLPTSTCSPTHPPSGWAGRRPIPAESFLELMQTDPVFQDGDPFAFWRVPEEFQRTDRFIGDFQTYGELSDFYLEGLARYGGVVPGGSGAPTYHGWPLGLTLFWDAFYFGLPTVGGGVYWQATIVNESEKVYGVGMTYDSVYIGINYDPLTNAQADAHYVDPVRGGVFWLDTGNKCANSPVPPGSACSGIGFPGGNAPAGILVLKSPIGDLRYKLFSDPDSEFFDPAHPLAGDTITFQHQRICGFGDCIPRTWTRSQRANFGMWSSTGRNVLDGETPGDLTPGQYHRIFRAEDWPQRTGQFNKFVPGDWDWNKDGIPDTIYADTCGRLGCVALWSDTLPGGFVNNYGNISMMSVGPVHMAPGDTVPFVVALVGAADSAGIESTTNNVIDFYMRFYLGPEAAPAPRITAVDVVPGGQVNNSISLFFDEAAETWEDPFLTTLDVSGDLELNPWLPDEVAARSTNNVSALHVFKSCDGGTTFTTQAGSCLGDAVSDPTSKWSGFGWRPYATLEATEDGSLPNTFTDANVVPGITYTYVLITETRGATFNLVRDVGGELLAETVEFAPSLLSSLSASSTNPNVAVVYVPVNLAAGARRAEINLLSRSGPSTVPVDLNVIGTAPVSEQFRTVFADSIQVTQVDALEEGRVISTQSSVAAWVLRSVTGAGGETERQAIRSFQFERSGTVTTSGLSQVSMDETETQRTTVWEGGFGMVLATSANRPLLASTTLTGDDATPGAFLGRDDFPFFVVAVDRSQGGQFGSETFIDAFGEPIPGQVAPFVVWRRGTGLSGYLSGDDYGTYELTWEGDAFGPGALFRINERATVASAFETSINQRVSASTSSTDPDDLAAVRAADPAVTLTDADLQAFDLPFTIRNATFDRNVRVVVTGHQSTVLLGQGADSLRVDVPEGKWVPGDVIHLVEDITRDVLDENGNVVLGNDGQPQTETVAMGTFRVVLGCIDPRNSCDPTLGGSTTSGYVLADPGTQHLVEYFVPLRAGDELTFEVQRAVSALDALAEGRPSLDGVHVVPNPYVFASRFERNAADRVLKFTAVPPEGRIRIFDVAGRFVQEINWVPSDLNGGDLDWDLQTRESLELSAGLYIFVLEADGERKMGKFVVIR